MTAVAKKIAAAAGALLLWGCEVQRPPCFTPASIIEDARVLSVRVDPPEPVVDLDAGEVPAIAISALFVVGAKDRFGRGSASEATDATAVARFCVPPPDADRPQTRPGCPADAKIAGQSLQTPSPSAPLILQPPLELLRRSLLEEPLRGFGGVKLRLQLDLSRNGKQVSATKTLLFHQKGQPGSVNHPIELVGVSADLGVRGGVQGFAADQVIPLAVTQVIGLRPLLGTGVGADGPVETYEALNPDGTLSTLREQVSYRFYAANTLVFQRPDYTVSQQAPAVTFTGPPGGDEADEPEDPSLFPHGLVSAYDAWPGNQSGTLWIVARDGRGAEAWVRMQYSAREERGACCTDRFTKCCPQLFYGCL